MIKFIFKGLIRDRHRSLLPIIVVTLGVMLTVFLHCWITGILGDFIDSNARFNTGHVKITTRAYAENSSQSPIDLAILGVDELIHNLQSESPDITWVKRINFGGLLDVPDENGETKAQSPSIGMAIDLFSEDSSEKERLNISKALVTGTLPEKPGEILISDEFAAKLGVKPGDTVTILSSTMYGSMAMYNFNIAGTIKFGMAVLDKGAIIVDITDAQFALDMTDASGEILGYFENDIYNDLKAQELSQVFNENYSNAEDEFSPLMKRLKEQGELASMFQQMDGFLGIIITIFVLTMSIVLWNAGLIGGLRRYGEVGVRLAIGENKGHVYRSMIYESVIIGFMGSVIGTMVGLIFAYILQVKGIDFSAFMKNTTMMIQSTYRTQITPQAYYIGFLPGLFSTVLGTMLAGIGIYRRKTAQLFKELEV